MFKFNTQGIPDSRQCPIDGVKEVVLFAKVVISTLALLPFFVFIEKRLGQHCFS